MINYLVLPTAADMRGARVYLNWKQLDLAYKCGVSIPTITAIETEKSKPTKELLEKIAQVFAEENIYFLPGGGHKVEKEVVKIFGGREGYFRVVEDVMESCATNKDEFLLLGADDRRSSSKVNSLYKEMYKIGIPFKQLIASDNDYVVGPLEDYRKTDRSLFFSNDVVIVYKTKVMFFIQKEGDSDIEYPDNVKNLLINDKELAETFRKYFYRLWNNAEKINKSSAKQIFFKKSKC